MKPTATITNSEVETQEGVPPEQTAGEQETITLTKDEYQQELQKHADRHWSKSSDTLREKIKLEAKKEFEEDLEKAKERANMSAEQLYEAKQKDLEKKEFELKEKERLMDLKDQVKDFLIENNIDSELLPVVLSDSLEQSQEKYNVIKTAIDKAVEDNNNKWKLKGGTPQTGVQSLNNKEWKDLTVTERLEIKNSDPERYRSLVNANSGR